MVRSLPISPALSSPSPHVLRDFDEGIGLFLVFGVSKVNIKISNGTLLQEEANNISRKIVELEERQGVHLGSLLLSISVLLCLFLKQAVSIFPPNLSFPNVLTFLDFL